MQRLILAALLFAAVPSAWAQWTRFAKDGSGNTYYYDPDAITKYGDQRHVWTLEDFTERQAGGHLSLRSYYQYDCPAKRYRILAVDAFSKRGASGRESVHGNPQPRWTQVPPHSLESRLMGLVCPK